jgi:hypothetical protein
MMEDKYLPFYYNHIFAHEFAHLIGAQDKYGEYDPEGIYEANDLMKEDKGSLKTGNVIISQPTAQEIGWLE